MNGNGLEVYFYYVYTGLIKMSVIYRSMKVIKLRLINSFYEQLIGIMFVDENHFSITTKNYCEISIKYSTNLVLHWKTLFISTRQLY